MRKPSGKMEKRAAAACEGFGKFGGGSFTVIWKRSATWGLCPSISYRGEKAAHASGYGYDKLSQVVAEFLVWLEPAAKWTGGAGIQSTIEAHAAVGWRLVHTYSGEREDGFRLERVEAGKVCSE